MRQKKQVKLFFRLDDVSEVNDFLTSLYTGGMFVEPEIKFTAYYIAVIYYTPTTTGA